jgi:hypothetical protein
VSDTVRFRDDVRKQVDDFLDRAIADGMLEKRVVDGRIMVYPIGPGSGGRSPRALDWLYEHPEVLLDDTLNPDLATDRLRPTDRVRVPAAEYAVYPDERLAAEADTRSTLVAPVYQSPEELLAGSAAAHAAYTSLLHKRAPVWAGARGFALAYEECLRRARILRELGEYGNADELTILHCQIGITLGQARVLTVTAEQVDALPGLERAEALAFLRGTPLPFEPFFIDYTAGDRLMAVSTVAARDRKAALLGVLLSTHSDQNNKALYVTPVFKYPSADGLATEPVALGSVLVNLNNEPEQTYSWLGATYSFDTDAVVALATTPAFKEQPLLPRVYSTMVEDAAMSAIPVLHLLDYSNVELVERTLERRERKRVEKRQWSVPLVVRVARPSRRVSRGQSDGMNPADYSHQFDVMGHPKHFTRGPLVACVVCGGKSSEALVCPRCGGTGMDPDKIKPCTRIDLATGERTCPNGCRRIWCPSYTKGPEDAPYVPKSRKLT